MNDLQRKKAAKAFAEYWKDKGYEKGESQPFWLSLLRDVLGVEHPEQYIKFEDQVKLDHTGFIDGFIDATHVMIEQKGVEKDLRKPIKQSDGTPLTPFQQAKRYSAELPYSQRPRWIITCNFKEFLIYDMEKPTGEPESILLSELEKESYRLQFLVEEKDELLHREEQISLQAGALVGRLYEAILNQYVDKTNEKTLHSLNILCVRLVFC
ncbi:MAG: methylase, partial [Clostridia bacterium]|nr:methylase [Clostridia bacterium]